MEPKNTPLRTLRKAGTPALTVLAFTPLGLPNGSLEVWHLLPLGPVSNNLYFNFPPGLGVAINTLGALLNR